MKTKKYIKLLLLISVLFSFGCSTTKPPKSNGMSIFWIDSSEIYK